MIRWTPGRVAVLDLGIDPLPPQVLADRAGLDGVGVRLGLDAAGGRAPVCAPVVEDLGEVRMRSVRSAGSTESWSWVPSYATRKPPSSTGQRPPEHGQMGDVHRLGDRFGRPVGLEMPDDDAAVLHHGLVGVDHVERWVPRGAGRPREPAPGERAGRRGPAARCSRRSHPRSRRWWRRRCRRPGDAGRAGSANRLRSATVEHRDDGGIADPSSTSTSSQSSLPSTESIVSSSIATRRIVDRAQHGEARAVERRRRPGPGERAAAAAPGRDQIGLDQRELAGRPGGRRVRWAAPICRSVVSAGSGSSIGDALGVHRRRQASSATRPGARRRRP